MISCLDAKISLNYLYPEPERIILVFCCQMNHWHSWPHKNYLRKQLSLLVSHGLVLKALYTFKNIYTIALVLISWIFSYTFPTFSFCNALPSFLIIWRWILTTSLKEWDQPSLSASSSVPPDTPYLGFHPFDMCFSNRQEFILNLYFFVKYSSIKGYYSCHWQQFGKKKVGWVYSVGLLICTGL